MNVKYMVLIVIILTISPSIQSRDRISLNAGWKFQKPDSLEIDTLLTYSKIRSWMLPTGNNFLKSSIKHQMPEDKLQPGKFGQVNYDDSGWRSLDLPHDWGIEGPFIQDYAGETGKLPWMGVAWYRKSIDIPAEDKNKEFILEVDGAMSYATVWVNGHFAGGWPYGYASFQLNLTPFIHVGEKNLIAIRLDNPDNSSRWYPGGGIYRNVWLTKNNAIHIDQWGTFVTTSEITHENANVNIEIQIRNAKKESAEVTVVSNIYKQDIHGKKTGKQLASSTSDYHLNAEYTTLKQVLPLINPELWEMDSPNMYIMETIILKNNTEIDCYDTPFGIRSAEFTAQDGFHLNGKRVRLQGVCMHHDLGALGAAFHYRAMERQLEILKEMGVNAIRTSHNPPAPEMLDLCDRMGFLVLDEFVDTWIIPKKENGYNCLFIDWHEQDLRALIRRDRNHPSVIAWSIGNEVAEQQEKFGVLIAKRLASIVKEEDSTRPSTIGNDNPNAGFNGFETAVDVFGYNYKPNLYSTFKTVHPHIPLYGSETASCISTRGEYLFPVEDDKSGGKIGFFMSSYDLYAPAWASSPDVEFLGQDLCMADAGEFVWTGFDYLGEPTPFTTDMSILTNYHDPIEKAKTEKQLQEAGKIVVPSRSSYFGIVDLAGFKKDRFYIYQARWRPEFPMVHILPHWNWPERIGQITPVHVYTSGDAVELFVNGKSLGKKSKKEYEYRLRWDDVVYEPGEIKAIAYKNGEKWSEETVKTTEEPYALHMEADRTVMHADGNDLMYVTVKIVDRNGALVPCSHNHIEFDVAGAARIIATDNGDQTSHALFQNTHIKAFNGMALVILKSKKNKSGSIVLTGKSKGLKKARIELRAN